MLHVFCLSSHSAFLIELALKKKEAGSCEDSRVANLCRLICVFLQRMWQRGVNSDIVLKLMGRGTGPVAGNGVPPGAAASRGRGSSMDRGRGRGRGLGSVVGAYNRGTSYEDEGEHARRDGPPTGYGRGGRPFERTQVTQIFHIDKFTKK